MILDCRKMSPQRPKRRYRGGDPTAHPAGDPRRLHVTTGSTRIMKVPSGPVCVALA